MADESLRYLFGAEKEYLESFYDEVALKYGDFAMIEEDPDQETYSCIVNAETGKYLYGTTDEKVDEIDEIIQDYLKGE